jgi:hypothetical protein
VVMMQAVLVREGETILPLVIIILIRHEEEPP